MLYIENSNINPYYNLALEEYLFTASGVNEYFMLWQNYDSIIVGRFQNSAEEINAEFVKEHGIKVVRRLTGGGAVYHDLGNLNYTFIMNMSAADENAGFRFEYFSHYIRDALARYGVQTEFNSRNDITVDGQKFSGNSEYSKGGRILHHGTILFDSDLNIMNTALKPSDAKFKSGSTKSVRSRVTNISPFLPHETTIEDFKKTLKRIVFADNCITPYFFDSSERSAVTKLSHEKYATWGWNYGKSPRHNVVKKGKCDGGIVEIFADVQNGIINSFDVCGDFFVKEGFMDAVAGFNGIKYEESSIAPAAARLCLCMHNMNEKWLQHLLMS
ncbi:MAG: lipoate--protein ligase [Crenarchaeota archaeon]|nr:lipoate--protein ligase [Thermoproteota archaeon]